MDVYVMKEGRRQGPFQPFRLTEMLDEGTLTPQDIVWHEGMEGWGKLAETESLQTVFKRAAPEPGAAGDTEAPRTVKPPSVPLPAELTMALLRQRRSIAWRRFFARQIDMTIFVILLMTAGTMTGVTDMWSMLMPESWVIMLAPALLWILIETAMLSTLGWTPGRMALGLRVVMKEGGLPPMVTALKRSALVWAGGIGFGLPMLLWLPLAQWLFGFWQYQRHGNTLWDRTANTTVVFRPLNRGHATGLAILTAAVASVYGWLLITVPLPARMKGEEREQIEQFRRAASEIGAPAPRNSGLPSGPGA